MEDWKQGMTRRQMAFIIVINAVVSLMIVMLVTWIVEARRPDLEQLAAIYTPMPQAILAPTATSALVPAVTQPTLAAQTPTAPANGETDGETYIVQPGDSLLTIATRFGVSVDAIVKANNLSNPDYVFSGQRLLIPRPAAVSNAATTEIGTPSADNITVVIQNGNDLAQEAVLIVNDSDQLAFNLEGWRLERIGGPVYTFANLPMFPGGNLRLNTRAGTNTSVDLYWSQDAPLWPSGAQGRLITAQGAQIKEFTAP